MPLARVDIVRRRPIGKHPFIPFLEKVFEAGRPDAVKVASVQPVVASYVLAALFDRGVFAGDRSVAPIKHGFSVDFEAPRGLGNAQFILSASQVKNPLGLCWMFSA